jgi:signal peptidase
MAHALAVYWLINEVFPGRFSAEMSVYVVQPGLWLSVGVAAGACWWRATDDRRVHAGIVLLALLAGAFQISVLLSAGVLFGFGHSPYARGALEMAKNGWFIFSMIAGVELCRAYLFVAWSRVHGSLGFVVPAAFCGALMIPTAQYSTMNGSEIAMQRTGETLLPAFSESTLATFLVSAGGPLASFTYRFSLMAFEWFSPILPDLDWSIVAFIGTLAPVLAMMIIRDAASAREETAERRRGVPLPVLAGMAVVVTVIWLNTGLLGVRPALVSGHSMEPAYAANDLLFTREVDAESLRVGDVIRFQQGPRSVAHRIIEIERTDAGPVFVTQGDNNNAADAPIVAGQIEGKVVFDIPKAGWVTTAPKRLLQRLF